MYCNIMYLMDNSVNLVWGHSRLDIGCSSVQHLTTKLYK